MVDDGILAVIGAAIVGFGIVAFVFRIQRELDRYRPKDRWIPWADRLLIGIVIVALLFVLFPIALAETFSDLWGKRLPAAAASASAIALAGYIPALLAHYRFGPRYRPVKGKEPVYDEGGPSPTPCRDVRVGVGVGGGTRCVASTPKGLARAVRSPTG